MQNIRVSHIPNEFVTGKNLIEDVLDIFLINSVCVMCAAYIQFFSNSENCTSPYDDKINGCMIYIVTYILLRYPTMTESVNTDYY